MSGWYKVVSPSVWILWRVRVSGLNPCNYGLNQGWLAWTSASRVCAWIQNERSQKAHLLSPVSNVVLNQQCVRRMIIRFNLGMDTTQGGTYWTALNPLLARNNVQWETITVFQFAYFVSMCQCSALTVWCSNFHMWSVVPNQALPICDLF